MRHTYRFYLGQPVLFDGQEYEVVARDAAFGADGSVRHHYKLGGRHELFRPGCLRPVPAPAPGFEDLVCEEAFDSPSWMLAATRDAWMRESLCSADYDHWAQVCETSDGRWQVIENHRRTRHEDLGLALVALIDVCGGRR